MNTTIYTIGRQHGSGGRIVGEKLAKKLGIPFYDKELITLAAEESGMSKEVFAHVDEQPTNSFLYSLAMGSFNYTAGTLFTDMSLNDKLFLAQSNVIKEKAAEGGCVIVGRCADYVLKDYPHLVNTFIYCPKEDRISRIAALENLSREKAADAIVRKEKKTASYYNYYANQKWGAPDNYDLLLNSSAVGLDGCVDLIIAFAEKMALHQKD